MICPGVNFTESFAWGSRRATAETQTASAWVLDKLALWVLWPERGYWASPSLYFSFIVGANAGWTQLPIGTGWATWRGRVWNGRWSTDRTPAEMWGGMKGPRRESTRWVGKGTEIFCHWNGWLGRGFTGNEAGEVGWGETALVCRCSKDQANDHRMFNCIRWCLSVITLLWEASGLGART